MFGCGGLLGLYFALCCILTAHSPPKYDCVLFFEI